MRPSRPHPWPALVLTLASGLPATAQEPLMGGALLGQHQIQQPQRVAQAVTYLKMMRPQLGLSEREGFVPRHSFTNQQGQAIVTLNHTYDGHRVWGSQAVARVLPEGVIESQTKGLRSGISLEGEPRLRGDEAIKLAVAHLAPKGALKEVPSAEQVVFPAQFLGGMSSIPDPQTGRPVLDRKNLVHAKLSKPFVWAYEVRAKLNNREDGLKDLVYLIDANTGSILRINDLIQQAAATTPTPARGTGLGFYRGSVTLNTSKMLDKTYALYDTTRGTLPNPGLSYITSSGTWVPDGSGWSPTGLQIWYGENDTLGNPTYNTFLFQANPKNVWGDGQAFTSWGNENGRNGQTAGVDALSAMTTTWDFYKKVFGREGMDGLGTSAMAYVLMTNAYSRDNAYWSIGEAGMYLGVGTYPANPNGFQSMTDLDVIAHEMTHGVSSPSQTQYWVNSAGFEEAGLNEATSDFFSQMVKTYASRAIGASDTRIPATGTDWQIGMNVGHGTPIRRMDKPSSDQRSQDGWYDGLRYMDGHFSAGPLNRALFFLAQGASSSSKSASYSVYLPGGMTGIGNDAAARIWFKTVTERLIGDGTGSLTFESARTEALSVAEELYGHGSTQVIAVENAFAAVNVGDAHGQKPRPKVLFADWRNGDYIVSTHTTDYDNRQVFPKGETVVPLITVLNASNTEVAWSLGGPSMFNGADPWVSKGGVLNADGSWTTPNVMGWHSITGTSKTDPNYFAEGRTFLIDMDTDMDLEQDALDMAGIAFSWYLTNSLNPAHSVFEAPWVDDADVAFFVDAMKSTWPVK